MEDFQNVPISKNKMLGPREVLIDEILVGINKFKINNLSLP